jgi:hypothetical protein
MGENKQEGEPRPTEPAPTKRQLRPPALPSGGSGQPAPRPLDASDGNKDDKPAKEIFGIRVVRETNVVAAVALLLSLLTATWQVIQFFTASAKTTLLPPDQVYLFKERGADKLDRVLFVMNYAYVNSGPQGYDDIIRWEGLRLRIDGKAYDYGWDSFGTIKGELGSKLRFEESARSLAFAVPGKGAVTHQTRVVPWPVDCTSAQAKCDPLSNHVYWPQFLAHLQSLVSKKERSFVFHLVADLGVRKQVEVQCKISISPQIVKVIEIHGMYNPTCFSVDAPSH